MERAAEDMKRQVVYREKAKQNMMKRRRKDGKSTEEKLSEIWCFFFKEWQWELEKKD